MRGIVFYVMLFAAAWAAVSSSPVSNDDIREAFVSLVRLMKDTADKLERHEFRERQLGEQLKKSLASISKRTATSDVSIDSLGGAIARLEERLRASEEAADKRQVQNHKQLDQLEAKLERWQKSLEEVIQSQNKVSSSEENGDAISQQLSSISGSLKRLETRMTTTTPSPLSETSVQPDWHKAFLEDMNAHRLLLLDVQRLAGATVEAVADLPSRGDADKAAKHLLEKLDRVRDELSSVAYKSTGPLESKLQEVVLALNHEHEEIMRAITEASQASEAMTNGVTASYEQLRGEVQALAKVEQVLIQTADNVMDTKRRIEYGVHQILLEVGDLVKAQAKDLNTTFNVRFDNISATILDNQSGALANLSSKIEQEISQVWRQIGIMYQQLTSSAVALDKLQQQTDIYVNGSLQSMDNMKGKVGQITDSMSEVDSNLNYLLSRLSLVTQEFNQIKVGLGDALDNIKNSFLTVQNKLKDVGPGPIPIKAENRELPFQIDAN